MNAEPASAQRIVTEMTVHNGPVALHTRTAGVRGRGRDIVFVHGFAQSSRVFDRQMNGPLADRHRLVSYDLRGHGRSSKPDDPSAFSDGAHWSADLRCVIEKTGVRSPVLVGWSMGGRVVTRYVEEHGEADLAALVMIGSRTVVDVRERRAQESHPLLARMLSTDSATVSDATEDFVRACLPRNFDEQTVRDLVAESMLTPPAARIATQQWPGELAGALGRLNLPMLVLHGSADRVVPLEHAHRTIELARRARLEVFDGLGHMPFLEAPSVFDSALERFLGAVEGVRDCPGFG